MTTKLTPAELEARLAKRLAELQTLPQLTREIEIEITPIRKTKTRATATEVSPAPAETTFQDDATRAAKTEDPDAEGSETTDEDEADGDRFEISISSQTEVPRWFGAEILDHSAEAIDLSRAANGLAFCMDHDTTRQVGIVENIGVRKGEKKLRGVLRFSRSAEAQDVKRDVQDKIRKFISVGYRIAEIVLEKSSDEDGDTYRVTRWMPMEVSSVAVPADTTVGTDRSTGAETFPVLVRSAVQITASKPHLTTEVRANMDPKVAAEIMRLGSAHGIDQERVAKWIEENRSVDSVSAEILSEIAKRGSSKPLTQPAAEHVTLTEREQKEYRVTRGILTLANNQENNRADNCFELEVSQEIEKKTDASVKRHGGLFVPWNLGIDANLARNAFERLERMGLVSRAAIETALTTGTATKGKELVFTEPGAFIDYLYNRMLLKAFGAQTISGLQGNISFPKQTGRATGSWVTENPGTDVADSNLIVGSVGMSPKTYQSSTAYSRQLLAQSVIDVDMLCRADLAKDSALAFDAAGFVGTGDDGQPLGLMNTTGVQAYDLVDDAGKGAKPKWDDIVNMESMVEEVNADELGAFSWATTPGVKAVLKLTPRLSNTIGLPIWADDNTVDGYRAGVTNQLPKNITKSTSTDLMPLIYGCFAQMICGIWGSGFELVVDPYRLKKQGMIELTTFVMGDVALRQAPAFVVAKYCARTTPA